MRRTVAVLAAAASLVLAACSSSSETTADAAETTAASTTVDTDQYSDQVIDAFDATYPTEGTDTEAPPSDWAAFVDTIRDLQPPEGEETAHRQMVSAFDAYVDAREEAEDTCDESPGPGGPCFRSVSAAGDAWRTAMDRAYELPGLSWQALLG
ncbi:hypothetical protein [Geodermatophilus sp. SYSU D00766]